MLNQNTIEALLIAIMSATDHDKRPIRIRPAEQIFTDQALLHYFGWNPTQIDAMRRQAAANEKMGT